jgi:hypothetical protein
MPNSNPETLAWLDTLAALTTQVEKTPNATHDQLAEALGIPRSTVTFYLAIKACFDEGAIVKVKKAAPSFILSFNSARALSGLIPKRGKDEKVSDLQSTFHAALDITLSHRLKPKKIQALVKWLISGKPATEFDPKAKAPKTAVETAEPESVESEPEEESIPQAKSQKSKSETLGQQIGSRIDQFFCPAGSVHDSPKAKAAGGKSRSQKSKKGKSALVHLFKKLGEKLAKIAWKELFKLEHRTCRKLAHVIVPLHTSHSSRRHHKSGSFQQGFITLFLTPLHWVVYVLLQYGFLWMVAIVLVCPFVPALKPLLEWPFRIFAHFTIYTFPAWVWACAQTHLGPTLFIGVLLAIGLYYAWIASPLRISLLGLGLAYLIFQGRGWATLPSPFSQTTTSETQTVSVPTAVIQPVRSASPAGISSHSGTQQPASNSKLRTANSTPAASYQPSVSFNTPASSADLSPSGGSPSQTLYDPKLLEQEIAALPKNCVVKAFPVLTDEGMPGDLAVSRIQGVTDPDKYTLIIDGDKKTIVNIATTTTNLIINCKSTDPLNFNGSGPFNVFWEDVLYIHTDEIDISGENPSQYFHCTLIGSGAKNALTFRCNRADDLKHLVSALEYFIRNSRLSPSGGGLGHDTALAGMPYLYQGLSLNNDCAVEKLWANSPMDKAAVSLGDHFWSIGEVTSERQSRNDLEAGLSTLPVTFFYATASEWDRALTSRTPGSNSVRPRLRKITLPVN